jgi:hypothetical protein
VGSPFFLGLLVALGFASAGRAIPIEPGAADYGWLFDDGSGTTAAASFGGASASLENGADWSTDTPFAYTDNRSIRFDGNNDVVEVDDLSTALNGASAFSISLWVHSDSTNQNRAFWNGVEPSNSDDFGGRYDSRGWLNNNRGTRNLIKFGLEIDGTNYQYESDGGYQTTDWQHVLFTWESGSGVRLYVDGTLDNPSETSPGLATVVGNLSGQSRFLIGDGAKNSWAGEIDEFFVWRSALTGDNAEYLAQYSSHPIPEPSTALLLSVGLIGLALRRPAAL